MPDIAGMYLIQLIVILAVIGVLLWLINTYVPMAQPFKVLINVLVVLAVLLWLLEAFGVWRVGPRYGRGC